ncbi:MAG: GntR family transcriptional regulator [Planctomycetaceae bacterium]|nr:GntR family transcriptional regulator [Planctomycetaceae bacterium]
MNGKFTLRETAYRQIRTRILAGNLAPGERISEQALAEALGISRTPVRSAIRELEAEGLLEQVPRFGTIVRKTDRQDLEELYDLRRALESFAAEVAAESMPSDDVESLSNLCDDVDELMRPLVIESSLIEDPVVMDKLFQADMKFHLVILQATGNRRLMKSVTDSRVLVQWGAHATKPHHISSLVEAWEQHRSIVEAIRSRDTETARQAMIGHIEFSKELALTIFGRMQVQDDADNLLASLAEDGN